MVVCNGASSSARKVTSGVPQGTVLGSLLFLLYINDLPSKLQCTVRLFVDDFFLYAILVNLTSDAQLLHKLEEQNGKTYGKCSLTLKIAPVCASP